MEWGEVCADPNLKDLPYKIELDEWGNIVMSPVSIKHILYQDKLAELLRTFLSEGKALQEFPIQVPNSERVKVADVVWISLTDLAQVSKHFASPIAPEICIEVIFPENTEKETQLKKEIYFESGAQEFWVCDENGTMQFFDVNGDLPTSKRLPQFPNQIEI